jgi:hypothetical protein
VGGDLAVTVTRVCYCSRDDAMRSIDFKSGGAIEVQKVDRALRSATENIEAHLHRVFYPLDTTYYFDWPNQGGSGGGQYANPWRLWFDQYDCTVLTALASGGTAIPLSEVFLEPVNRRPGWPASYLELDRSTSAAFGSSVTPQHSISATGTWGFTADADQVTTLAASVGTGDTTITVADGSSIGAGDLMILGYGRGTAPYPASLGYAGAIAPYTGERILVTGVSMVSTGVSFSGPATASAADNVLAVSSGTAFAVGEVLLLDSERVLVTEITGNNLVLQRAWDGTVLAAHTSGTIYAARLLSVQRGQLGTTAATASNGAAVYKHRVPGLVRDLAIAETTGRVLQESSGYSRVVGGADAAMPASGTALAELWDEAVTTFGRKARHRAV